MKEKIKFIPACDCLEKIKEKELEEMEAKRQKECRENRIRKYRDISVIDKKFLSSTFDKATNEKYIQIAKKYSEKFILNPTRLGIIFYGGAGVGKTFTSGCIANYLMEKGKTVLIINLGLYLAKIKSEWDKINPEEVELNFLKSVENVDLLIIDDFGSEKPTEFTIEKLFNLIDKRYRAEKPLIITTNLPINFDDKEKCGISKYYKLDIFGRIRDRLKEMCFPVLVSGESKRKSIEKEFYDYLY